MDLQHKRDNNTQSNRYKNLLNEIVDIEKFRELDHRYSIVDVCKDMKLKYEFKEDICNVFHNSFSSSFSFNNKNEIKSVTCFIDPDLYKSKNHNEVIKFLINVFSNKKVNLTSNILRNSLERLLNSDVKEFKETKENFKIYANNIMQGNRRLIFMMIVLNA